MPNKRTSINHFKLIKMHRIAVIGGGISGLTTAHLLKNRFQVTVFEKESTPGGLIRCRRVEGNLFHTCGGHVFNSKRQEVLDWFWNHFDRDKEFIKTNRNSVVCLDVEKVGAGIVPYPIENHVYMMNKETQLRFIDDLLTLTERQKREEPENFEDFLRLRFGHTLFNLYFRPYNEKVWRRSLKSVPLSWLEGKLPMPTVQEMFFNNMNHIEERQFVHSSYWYEREGGSQFIADRLAEGLDICYNAEVKTLAYNKASGKWTLNRQDFDGVVFCGNIKQMAKIIKGIDLDGFTLPIENLEYHGTTSVFCEIDKNPYSWIYQPSDNHKSHRIICTGNFSPSNNSRGKMTGTVEFTDKISKDEIIDNLGKMPFHPKFLDYSFNEFTYPIQDKNTREMIKSLKGKLCMYNFYFTGRFADWEYYNMDVAMSAAMRTVHQIQEYNS